MKNFIVDLMKTKSFFFCDKNGMENFDMKKNVENIHDTKGEKILSGFRQKKYEF